MNLFGLEKSINSVDKLKKAISDLFNSGLKHIADEIEQNDNGDSVCVEMTS